MEAFHDIWRYLFLIAGGAGAGFINVMAGGGSLITLPVLMGVDLPTNIANGTNRVSVFMQDISATYKFAKKKRLQFKTAWILAVPTMIGNIIGALFASHISSVVLNFMILGMLILMFFYVMFRKTTNKTVEIDKDGAPELPDFSKRINVVTLIIFFIIGLYAGFIQAGAALLWFMAISWRLKTDTVSADAIRIFLSLLMVPVSMTIFALHHQVSFIDGVITGCGGFFGGWLGAKVVMKLSERIIRTVMLIVLAVCAIYVCLFKVIHI